MTRPRVGLLVALFASALALRPQLVGVGPLLPGIQDDLAVSHAVAGLLGTIPVLCMGLFAPPAPYLSSRLGSRYAIAACLAAIATFGVARALVPSAAAVILLTVPVGVGIGFAGALLPVAVKERFPHRPAFATGVYATGINLGSALSASLAVPIAGAAGGWRSSLLVFSVFTGALVVLWLGLTRGERTGQITGFRPPRPPFRSRIAWLLAAVFCLMAVVFYGLTAWLPDVYVERGWSESSAGGLIAVLNLASLPTTLLVPWLADHYGSRRLYLVSAAGLMTGALVGVVLAPGGAWAWAALTGIAIGALFPLVLTLPLDVADRPEHVGAVAGLMLGAGYAFSAVAPFGLGAIRDAAGDYTTVLWVIVAASAATLALAATLSPARLRRRPTPAGA
ncbi:MAG: MFS transporter [Thermoleophilia bacterium]|nr:MFS transporter [Thermoleophilia bacterium]